MMMIRCVMGAENLPAFVEGLSNFVAGMTVSETREFGPETTQTVSYRGVAYEVGNLSVVVDIVTDDSWIDDIIRKIHEAYTQDHFAVRHLYFYKVDGSYHIRNGFMDV